MYPFTPINEEPKELQGRFNSIIVTAFDDSMTVEMQIRSYIKLLKETIKLTNEQAEYLNEFIKNFDTNLNTSVTTVLDTWLKSGVFDDILMNTVLLSFKQELEQLQVQVDNKITKRENESIYPEMLSKSLLEMITNGSIDVNVNTSMIQDGAVTPTKTSFLSLDENSNLFNGAYENNRTLLGDANGLYYTESANAVSAIIKLPETTSTLNMTVFKKSPTDRFKIATFKNYPSLNAKADRVILDTSGSNLKYPFDILNGENYLVVNISSSNQVVPLNVGKTATFKDDNQHRYILNDKVFVYVADKNLPVGGIKMDKLAKPLNVSRTFNFFTSVPLIVGKWINASNGFEVTNENYVCSSMIEIDPRQRYSITGTNEQGAFYTETGKYISGYSKTSELLTLTIPTNAKYMRVSALASQKESVFMTTINEIKPVDVTQETLNYLKDQVATSSKVLTVRKSGGMYTRLRDALEVASQGDTILLGSGEWKLEEEYSVAEIKDTNFKGFEPKTNILLKGKGKDKTIVSATLSGTDFSDTDVLRVSTIHLSNSIQLANMTIVGKNVRYCIHDDYRNNMNVKISHVKTAKSGAGYPQALGGGTYSGQTHELVECEWYTSITNSSENVSCSYHTNVDFDEPSTIKLVNCRFNGIDYDVRIGCMKSNVLNTVELIGNSVKKVLVKEELTDGNGYDVQLTGYANTNFDVAYKSKNGGLTVPNLTVM